MSSTQKWIIGILIMISMGVSGFVVGQIKEINSDLQSYKMSAAKDAVYLAKEQVTITALLPEKYVLKEDYKCAIEDMKKQLSKMDDKLDRLIIEIKRK